MTSLLTHAAWRRLTLAAALGWVVGGWISSPAALAESPAPVIEIDAEDGIEWRRDEKVIVARGNARAVRGERTVHADVLRARYRTTADGRDEIWRLEADGAVEITSPTETIHAQRGQYDLDRSVVHMQGKQVRLLTDGSEIVADEMDYWTEERKLVARGNTEARDSRQRLLASTLTVFLADPAAADESASRLVRVEAENDVWVITPSDVLRGDRGTYDAKRDVATLTGNVRITRGANQLNGCRGEMDFRSGTSRLEACAADGGQAPRVHGLIVPETSDR